MPSWDEEQSARVALETAAGKKLMGAAVRAALSNQTHEQLLDTTCLWWWRFTEQAKISAALEAAKQSAEAARDAAAIELRQARAAIYALQTCLVAMKMLKPGNGGTVPELHAMDGEQG